MLLKRVLMVGTIVGMPALAMAQPVSGPYVSLGAGANILQNETTKGLSFKGGTVAAAGSNPKFDTGAVGVGAFGWGLGNGIRVELEGDYRWNQVRSVGGFGSATSGSEQKSGAMVNVFYDLDLSPYGLTGITPYVGAGAGYVYDDWFHVGVTAQGGPSQYVHVNSDRNTYAAQGIAGVAYALDDVTPGLALTAEYRFYDVPNEEKFKAQYFAAGVTAGPKLRVGNDLNHSVLVGLRYAFNTTPPPPEPEPAPAPTAPPAAPATRSYLVFFDWDRADLTDRARVIIADAADNAKRVQVTRIEVNGYTDLSGTPQYNQGLSVRRAQAVAKELTHDGVPSNVITIQGFGETHPLVPTAQGVREPQNRRVEIIIH